MRFALLAALLAAAWAGPVIPAPVFLNQCNAPRAAARQVFSYKGGALELATPTVLGVSLCVTAAAGGPGALIATPCLSGPPSNQSFTLDGRVITSALPGSPVVSIAPPIGGPYFPGIPSALAAPPVSNASTFFVVNTTGLPAGSAVLQHAASGLCLDAGPVPNAHACLDPALRYTAPFCNASLPVEERIANLLGQLTLAEKIALTGSGPWPDTCDTMDAGGLTPPSPLRLLCTSPTPAAVQASPACPSPRTSGWWRPTP